MQGPWVIGAISNQVWSIDGSNDRPNTSTFFTNVFLNYNFRDGWYVASQPIITADWQASAGNKWTVPVGGGFGKIQRSCCRNRCSENERRAARPAPLSP
jgi:hypothetical protein